MTPKMHAVVIGTGMMGPRIAMTLALGGYPATLVGRDAGRTERAAKVVEADLGVLLRHELVDEAAMTAARDRFAATTDLDQAVRGAGLVIESIVEHMPTKADLFRRLDEVCPPETILTSNTSALPVAGFAGAVRRARKARVAVTHYWNPPHLLPLVEVVRGTDTSDETVETLRRVMLDTDKEPVVLNKDVPGFLGNRLQHALKREAFYLVQEGIASAEDIDRAVANSFGLRLPTWGSLLHTDAVGLDLVFAIETDLLPHLERSAEPPHILKEMIARGDLGKKSGKGFFDWSERDFDALVRRRDDELLWRAKQRKAARGA